MGLDSIHVRQRDSVSSVLCKRRDVPLLLHLCPVGTGTELFEFQRGQGLDQNDLFGHPVRYLYQAVWDAVIWIKKEGISMSKLPNEDGGGILIPLLVSLLVVVGIGTAGLFGYFGFIASQNDKVPQDQTIEAGRSESGGSSAPQSSTGISYAGPGILIEDGEVTWRHEDDQQKELPDQTKTSQDIDVPEQPTDDQQTQTQNKGTDASGGKTQTGVNINPSSPVTNKPQNGGTNRTTQSGGEKGNNNLSDFPEYKREKKGEYIGSSISDKYHPFPGCSAAKKIKPENEVWFNSVEEARAANYKPCGNCFK